jgi:hypothetical protein
MGDGQNEYFESMVTFSDLSHEGMVTTAELPLYPYGFNPNLYQDQQNIGFTIPRNILRVIPESHVEKAHDISVPYYMPRWKYFEFTPSQQREFIKQKFSDRMSLYRECSSEDEQTILFICLWLYVNGGIYIGPTYELLKSLESILDNIPSSELYFTLDAERYISPEFLGTQPFCKFWLEVIELMDTKSTKHTEIRQLLTEASESTSCHFEMISRPQLNPYNACDTEYTKDSYLCPINRDRDFIGQMVCKTGIGREVLYITGAIMLLIALMIVLALVTN